MSNSDRRRPRRVLLGEITAAHGIRGEVIIRSYTAQPEDIATYGALTDADGGRPLTVRVRRCTAKGILAAVDGIADRTSAERLRGAKLYVARDRLPPLSEGEYYHADLIGLRAERPDGTPLGEVVAVVNYGAGDLMEIRFDGTSTTELVPLEAAYVARVDIEAGTVAVTMPVFANDDEGVPAPSPDGQ